MEGFIFYWLIVVVLFVVGMIQLIIKSAKGLPLKPALRLLIVSVIMLVIGAGACAVILSNLTINH
ncbi:hypothetical protein [Pedobacter sp. Leaf194]|uniref:hypothetical protein n=1 Tax=Pedobacter sp. Leaf194 TaxID=1736297 RepID=UPI000703B4F6|nr:hypothetical protein [Pedobacter sp. Leaf194]KQS35951.1 hypothetical protein ASG14_10905 [Pedobacter sp. Leaf194]